MPEQMPIPKYRCTQPELYAVCKLAWNSFEENLAAFTAFKTLYDAPFLVARRAEVNAAKAMPDDQARGAAGEMFGIQLKTAADTANLKWLTLTAYIKSSFQGALAKPQLEAAGHGYYPTANGGDWEDMESMLDAGKAFITTHGATLTASGGMPAAFPADYDMVKVAFSGLYDQFKGAPQSAKEGTRAKINANNFIYEKVMAMMDDGQILFYNDAAKRDKFIWAKVMDLVTPPKEGGIPVTSLVVFGKVKNATNGLGIPNAQVTMSIVPPTGESETVSTNANGDYYFRQDGLPPGQTLTVNHQVVAPGFTMVQQNVSMTVGQSVELNVDMNPGP